MSKHALIRSALCLAAAASLAAAVAGCSSVEPFVYDPEAFNRNAPDFGKTPDDIAGVDICYARYATTADTVSNLASEQCARFGKRAVPYAQDIMECPLLTPVRARYHCIAP